MPVLPYGCTTWSLIKFLEKNLDGNCTRMLSAVLNLEAVPYKTAAVRPLTFHLTNHPNKISKRCKELLNSEAPLLVDIFLVKNDKLWWWQNETWFNYASNVLVVFYGISTFIGYLMPKLVYRYIKYMIYKQIVYRKHFYTSQNSFVCTQLNCCKYYYLILTI